MFSGGISPSDWVREFTEIVVIEVNTPKLQLKTTCVH